MPNERALLQIEIIGSLTEWEHWQHFHSQGDETNRGIGLGDASGELGNIGRENNLHPIKYVDLIKPCLLLHSMVCTLMMMGKFFFGAPAPCSCVDSHWLDDVD